MHCPKCGVKVQKEDLYCMECGYNLANRKNEPMSRDFRWILPVLALILALGGLTGYYFYENQATKAAMKSFHQGETAAFSGKYIEAEHHFEAALKKRPHFPAAKLDLKVARLGELTKKNLGEAAKAKNQGNYSQALKQINQAETYIQGYSGKVTDNLELSINSVRGTTMVAKLEHDIKKKSSIQQLAPLLTTAESLNTPFAGKVEVQIRKKMVSYAYAKASDYLKENHFSEALTSVKAGLLYDSNNAKLLNMQKSIEEQQSAFAKAEENRIQQAMAAAAKEKKNNEHNAVKLVNVKAKLNPNGDLTVSGTVKNVAKIPISLVSVNYTLKDAKGKTYKTNETYVTPNKLYPGDKGTFDYTHFNVGKKMTVKVTGFKWEVNE